VLQLSHHQLVGTYPRNRLSADVLKKTTFFPATGVGDKNTQKSPIMISTEALGNGVESFH